MEFYESWREENQTVSCNADCNHFYPPHYHSNAEIYVCVSGAQKVTVNGVGYEVKSGEAVIIDNYAIHSYDLSRINDEDYVIIVPPHLLGEFKRLKGGLKIANPIIKDEKLVAEFAHICKFALLPVFFRRNSLCRNQLYIRARVYQTRTNGRKVRKRRNAYAQNFTVCGR